MLEAIFGNKNIQRILTFLLVNGKCYGTQLHRMLKTPLTPIQKALMRLERSGIIMSATEGKTRIYQFDPAFPLLEELELLLKKGYMLLPAHEKKNYYVPKINQEASGLSQGKKKQVLLNFWEKLASVKQLTFHAKTKSQEEYGWNGRGKGDVVIVREGHKVLLFNEKGSWFSQQGEEFNFSNTFRWVLDRDADLISLEHLRYGLNRPVFLFYLAPTGNHSLSSIDSYLCDGDAYLGQIHFDRMSLRLHWRVIGPKKNEDITYFYS
jgi:hypothetical protein